MLTSVILTKDEEKNISRCIKSLPWSDEIVVIDDYSTDKTVKIAKKFGAKIYKRHLNNDYASQRNFGLSKAKVGWVLFVDADEVVSQRLAYEIKMKFKNATNYSAFFLKRTDFFLLKNIKHGETEDIKLLRLAKKNSGKWYRKVHEYWKVRGKIGQLKNPILHYPHPTIFEFIEKVNRYSSLHSLANKSERKNTNLIKIIFFPLAKFFLNYFIKLGFLDGIEGFIIATLMSFHSFLSWSKQWTD